MAELFETVHTIDDYYDGPRSGVADFAAMPHHCRSVYLDNIDIEPFNPDEDRFELRAINSEILKAAMERALIFVRWDKMRKATPGFIWSDEEFGAMPEDRGRFRQLNAFLEAALTSAGADKTFLVHGKFQASDGSPAGLVVHWRRANNR